MPLLNLRDITLAFGGPPLFDGISLQIEPGDRLCLMGRNGTGKSTLLRLIAGELLPEGSARGQDQLGVRLAFLHFPLKIKLCKPDPRVCRKIKLCKPDPRVCLKAELVG